MFEAIPWPIDEKKCFKALEGWLKKLKYCHALHFSPTHKEAACADHEVAKSFKGKFKGIIEGYLLDQIFNAVETGFFFIRKSCQMRPA